MRCVSFSLFLIFGLFVDYCVCVCEENYKQTRNKKKEKKKHSFKFVAKRGLS